MKWVRILVKNDGRSLPMEVTISCGEIKYYFPIWAECRPRFELIPENIIDVAGENETFYPTKGFTQQSSAENICNKVPKSHQFRDFGTRKHVSSEETAGKSIWTETRDRHVILNEKVELGLAQMRKQTLKRPNSPDYASQVIFNDFQGVKSYCPEA
ncbi:hypothetical protein FXO37_00617 [Capsicum annuum]|nr:hypothetical protein FXO37_00617 [Capsicum annuum]